MTRLHGNEIPPVCQTLDGTGNPSYVQLMDLSKKKCIPCERGASTATDEQIRSMLAVVQKWNVVSVDGIKRLTRTFTFKNFVESVSFVNRVKNVAEAEGHHPDVHISWNTVRLENWTHVIGGLHENDFILAAKIDAAYPQDVAS
ncbi:MAG: 4a-hydroxytetrahydrobiopterin dehydratase [Candidatus Kerfeldbacteria bacterium]|nr:4a-hydroxytetrahydrobiopterin dehydratase [Candidatus Kerfeldbacteria bacterium]